MTFTTRSIVLTLLLGSAASLPASPAAAEDRALLIANDEYRRLDDLDLGGDLREVRRAIEGAGFEVDDAYDADQREMLRAVKRFADRADADDGRLVVLLGQFVRVGSSLWMLGADVDGFPDLTEVPAGAVPVDLIAAAMGGGGGRAALLLGGPDGDADGDGPVMRGLEPGSTPVGLRVPVAAGDADAVMDAVREVLTRPGGVLREADLRQRGLSARGLDGDGMAVLGSGRAASAPEGSVEGSYWEVVERFDNRTGYESYLRRYPNGQYARVARDRLAAITEDPSREAREAEADLNLSREDRRGAQSDLVLLGFDTRGVDGIFGAGSRRAIGAWQARNGYEETGFLTGEQLRVLDAQGARRQAELDVERERRRAEVERGDRDYWARTGADGSADGLRRYLERFPDGVYASGAEARLDAMAEEARGRVTARDRRTWRAAQERDRPGDYRRYLEENPDGAYRDAALRRLRELTGSGADAGGDGQARRLAEETEARLGLDPIGRRLVEAGLEAFGLEPGPVDGTFDRDTRRALRRYQEARGLPVTGFMSQDIVVRMLAERILR